MKAYWSARKDNSTLETMMLDSNAKVLHEMEAPEILGKLPTFQDKHVLEMAAGIGRYTRLLAEKAASVTTVEFIENFHETNVKTNGVMGNCTFLCGDVCELEREPSEFDLVFSNWLHMYLYDEQVMKLADKCLKWLKPGGHLFLRESCFRQSGDMKRAANPTHYRHPSFYLSAFGSVCIDEGSGVISQFELVSSSSVSVYQRMKKNSGQICFLFKKVTKPGTVNAMDSFQRFLDRQQYSVDSISRYEKIFGDGYVSTGGQDTTTEFVAMLDLKPGEKVLDVGCGIGGGDFYMADTFGVSVVGIDLSANMIHRALERSLKSDANIEFEICDATAKEYPAESFDVIYSRDTILHIQDKKALFDKFFYWLKPGGRLLISDYCCGEQAWTEQFAKYVAGRGYHLISPAQYGKVLESSGFCRVVVQDRTDQFKKVLQAELDRTLLKKDEFIQETSENDLAAIVQGWQAKLERCADGDQKWGLFMAQKEYKNA